MTINAKLFAEAGEVLLGPEWKRGLAALLDMNERTVFRIAKAVRDGEDYPVNPALGPVLAEHLARAAVERRTQAEEAERLAAILSH